LKQRFNFAAMLLECPNIFFAYWYFIKEEIYKDILYNYTCLYTFIYIYIYSYMKNFLPEH